MLSAESASGAYPIEAVEMMDRILQSTERDPLQRVTMDAVASHRHSDARDAISAAIRTVAETLPVAATVAYTSSGATTLRVAHERPRAPILSMTPIPAAARRLSLVWGCIPFRLLMWTALKKSSCIQLRRPKNTALVNLVRPC